MKQQEMYKQMVTKEDLIKLRIIQGKLQFIEGIIFDFNEIVKEYEENE